MMYEISDLRLSFPDLNNKPLLGAAPRIEVLKGLSFDVPKGAVLGIVGGSGSGKSTLGRAMLRLLEPTAGSIKFDGNDITHQSEDQLRGLRRRFQMIFQDPMSSLNPRRRVGGIIAGPLRLHGLDGIPARIDEALDMVGLPRSFAQRYPHELSGGQRQRVGIARAIALRPDFILADEIVSGLDVSSQAQVLNLLGELVRELGLTLAFISHDLSVIRRLCSRVLVLHLGEIVEEAETAALFAAPQAEYTRTLMNAIPLPDPDQPWE
ncbi:ABC transporter ATP-binding protein [Sulfitobacter noctilucicola]|uniref:Peptide/nickel transport system ATP-binding protein n=1 Tax=Sulfitobacter noctilucicola TaxID=1342301 RepID=A0A7W6M9G0_9RHOB|nr:ATP-binding cassette domain-containing protein [Sulfitobacter noctilucicola]KIN63880.1 ABC transporter ATP-binding protein [Sulfitobacter noctilucicola]MBB4174612.1 peptide/nickel transport system ATP-binding protein [Sulfitobacter noctilucicola]